MRTLAELKAANLPHATVDLVGLQLSGDPEKVQAATDALNEYLRHFLAPDPDAKCVQCGMVQGGMTAAIMGTGFQYGMVHGEGTCGTCGYPARAYHNVEGVGTMQNWILQYHPDELGERKPEPEADTEGATA